MIYIIAYCLTCICLAADNADRIRNGKRIFHGLNGSLHAAAAGMVWYLSGLVDAISLLFAVRVVFDLSLNLFRGKGLFYTPLKPQSKVDQFENWLFRSKEVAVIFEVSAFVILRFV